MEEDRQDLSNEYVLDLMATWAATATFDTLHRAEGSTLAYIADREPNESRFGRMRLEVIQIEIDDRTRRYIEWTEDTW